MAAALLDLAIEVLTCVCLQLDLRDLIRVGQTCKRFRHGESGLELVELPTKSPYVTALREHAFPGGVGIPSSISESWVAYLTRCARQRRCREAPPIAAGNHHTLFVGLARRLLACGKGDAVGHGDWNVIHPRPAMVRAEAGISMRSVAAGVSHSLALGWDGRFYSWGRNVFGVLGQGDHRDRSSPMLLEGLEGVRSVAASNYHSLAVTQAGGVFQWGLALLPETEHLLQPSIVEGFGGVRVRRVCAGDNTAFAIGEDGEVFSWGRGRNALLGHGDSQNQPSPKRVEALRGVRVSIVSVGSHHALALAEDGLVYAWGENLQRALLGDPHVERELLPKPVEALRGMRVGSVAAGYYGSFAVTDTGELWAWGRDGKKILPLGHGELMNCPLPKPVESLRNTKVDAVIAFVHHTLALADDGSVYVWGSSDAAGWGALGLGAGGSDAGVRVPRPQRIPELTCGL
jgi:alpha-tubulin suppressor-like RCC1 family protein